MAYREDRGRKPQRGDPPVPRQSMGERLPSGDKALERVSARRKEEGHGGRCARDRVAWLWTFALVGCGGPTQMSSTRDVEDGVGAF
jgi:hypothetical protein